MMGLLVWLPNKGSSGGKRNIKNRLNYFKSGKEEIAIVSKETFASFSETSVIYSEYASFQDNSLILDKYE